MGTSGRIYPTPPSRGLAAATTRCAGRQTTPTTTSPAQSFGLNTGSKALTSRSVSRGLHCTSPQPARPILAPMSDDDDFMQDSGDEE